MHIPILTYHAMNVASNRYAENDHLALAQDLQTIRQLGLRVISLSSVVDWWRGLLPDHAVEGCLAITMDDGSWFDYYDLNHPTCGPQRSMLNIARDFRNQHRGQPAIPMSSFVIASPKARSQLDRSCMLGKGWWDDDWWEAANQEEVLSIECHSWDHTHPTLDQVAQKDNQRGNFAAVACYEDCYRQVVEAAAHIEAIAGRRPEFFAYPYGQASAYLRYEFMPKFQHEHRFNAAFSILPKAVEKSDDRWFLPRYVCGRDWQSTRELKALISS